MLISGLLIMADWLASNSDYFPMIHTDTSYVVDIETRVNEAFERINLPDSWQPELLFSSEGLCEKRFTDDQGVGYKPNAVQRAMMCIAESTEQPGIMILEAQMGVGKTEAALLAAELLACGISGQPKRGGIYFGLPTQATANGIFSRVSSWAERISEYTSATIRLVHGSAMLNEAYVELIEKARVEEDATDSSNLTIHEWFAGSKRELLSDFVIGTVDQLLMAALKRKHVMLRHLGLCGKVVIIDEVHAYDTYMSQYLEMALTWLGAYRVPVILLSATLPPLRRSQLIKAYLGSESKQPSGDWENNIAYPLLTWTCGCNVHQQAIDEHFVQRNVSIMRASFYQNDLTALANHLSETLVDGGCAGVIVNTVKRAQQVAEVLTQLIPNVDVLLLHAQYVMTDRIAHENELLRRIGKHSGYSERNRLIVVGTQVIEQSLDIDVDYLITDLCPMDLLLQRIGRLHRHSVHDAIRPISLREARCMVLGANQLDEGSKAVYGEYILMRTSARLPDNILLPQDIPNLVRDVYDADVPLPLQTETYNHAKQLYDLQCAERIKHA